ncbi:hypothetical protein ACH5AO_13330 [Streptomyces sp. NPDC018964]|uniref:hypothetical protein n=1 Tax=unclassified Streptomyces TaxID=2593676 RepID=UPI0037AF0633
MRDVVHSLDDTDTVPGKFEITKKGIVHDMTAPIGPRTGTGAVFDDIHPADGPPRCGDEHAAS